MLLMMLMLLLLLHLPRCPLLLHRWRRHLLPPLVLADCPTSCS